MRTPGRNKSADCKGASPCRPPSSQGGSLGGSRDSVELPQSGQDLRHAGGPSAHAGGLAGWHASLTDWHAVCALSGKACRSSSQGCRIAGLRGLAGRTPRQLACHQQPLGLCATDRPGLACWPSPACTSFLDCSGGVLHGLSGLLTIPASSKTKLLLFRHCHLCRHSPHSHQPARRSSTSSLPGMSMAMIVPAPPTASVSMTSMFMTARQRPACP